MSDLTQAGPVRLQPPPQHLEWLDKEISDQFLCGPRFTLADILLFSFLTFADSHGNPIDKKLERVWAWIERVEARPTMSRL